MKPENIKVQPGWTKTETARNKILVLLTLASTLVYLAWRICFTLPFGFGIISLTAGFLLLFFESMGLVESMIHYYNLFNIVEPETPEIPPDAFPDIDIYIATYQEPLDLLYKTINGCKHIEYPDKSKVHIHLCDDGRRAEAKALAEKTGINYISRSNNKGAKAGNLNNAMTITSAPLLLILDADMIPKHDILLKMVPFFVAEEIKNKDRPQKEQVHIGFVQSPQAFYNPDLFQFNLFSETRIPNEQDYFYRDIQVSRNASNSPIFGGSNAILSRKALNDIGGFFTGSITEDFATGCLIQRAGYRCYAISEALASGLSPSDLPSLIQQRIRWGRGCISTGKQLHLLTGKGLTLHQRLNYFASVWYWYSSLKRLVYFMGPVMYTVFGFTVLNCTLAQILAFWLPMYIFNNITLNLLSKNIRSLRWTNIYETVMFPFMLIPVILESVGISLKKFKVTKKDKSAENEEKYLIYAVPFVIILFLSVIGLVRGFSVFLDVGIMSPLVTLFWLAANTINLVMALFFTIGRKLFRSNERVVAEIPCSIHMKYHEPVPCRTIDFSEDGISVRLENPIDIDEEEVISLEFVVPRYRAMINAKIVHVDNSEKGWKYAFHIEDYRGTYDDYLGILYDRVPTLPSHIEKTQSIYDELKTNITVRKKGSFFLNRRYPRIEINGKVPARGQGEITVVNFNYRYVLIDHKAPPEKLVLEPVCGVEIHLELSKADHKGGLYTVTNYKALHEDSAVYDALGQWLAASARWAGESGGSPATEDILLWDIAGRVPGSDKKALLLPAVTDGKTGRSVPSAAFPWRMVYMPFAAMLALAVTGFFSFISRPSGEIAVDELPGLEETARDLVFPGLISHFLESKPAETLGLRGAGTVVTTLKAEEALPLMIWTFDGESLPFTENSGELAQNGSSLDRLASVAEELLKLPEYQRVRLDGYAARGGRYYRELELSFSRVERIAGILVDMGISRSHLVYEQRYGWGSYIVPKGGLSRKEQHRTVITTPVFTLSPEELGFSYLERTLSDSQETAEALDKTAASLNALLAVHPGLRFRVEGPVVRTGSKAEELGLSLNRARRVAEALIARGVPETALFLTGRSTDIPISRAYVVNMDRGVDIVPVLE